MFLAHHGGGRGVVAEEQLAVLSGAAAGAVPPGGLGVGAVAGAAGRGAGKGFHVGPVDGQRRAGVLELLRDGCFEQVVADALQPGGGQPVGDVLGQRAGDEAEGALGLAVSQPVRAVLPVRDHAEAPLVVLGQRGQRLVDAGQVGGPVVGQHGQHAQQQGADQQLAGADPDGQQQLDPRRDAGAVDDLLQDRQRDHGRPGRPEQPDRVGLGGGFQAGEQVAEPLGAGDPGGVHERGQPEQVRDVGQPGGAQPGGVQPGQPGPAGQRPDQRRGDVPAAGIGPAADQPGPGGRRRGQQPVVVAGQHRHRPRPGAARTATITPPDRQVTSVPCTSRRSARISPAPAPRQISPARPHPPLRGGLGVRQGEIPGDLRRAVGRLGPLPGQRHVLRIQLRHHPAADEPQVRPQRPPRHAGQPRRAPGEPLDHRRVQQHLRCRVQAERDRVIGEPGRRPQQVLRPLLPARRRRPAPPAGRTPRPAATPTTAATARYSRRPGQRRHLRAARHSLLSHCRYTVGHDQDKGSMPP